MNTMPKCPSMDRNNPMYEMEEPDIAPPDKCDACGSVFDSSLWSYRLRSIRWSPYLCQKCNQEIDEMFRKERAGLNK